MRCPENAVLAGEVISNRSLTSQSESSPAAEDFAGRREARRALRRAFFGFSDSTSKSMSSPSLPAACNPQPVSISDIRYHICRFLRPGFFGCSSASLPSSSLLASCHNKCNTKLVEDTAKRRSPGARHCSAGDCTARCGLPSGLPVPVKNATGCVFDRNRPAGPAGYLNLSQKICNLGSAPTWASGNSLPLLAPALTSRILVPTCCYIRTPESSLLI